MSNITDDLYTIRDWLRWAVSHFNKAGLFFGHGCDNAWDEAVWLVLHTLHLPPAKLEPFLDARLTHQERKAVLNLLQTRIEKRIPAAYLTHEAWLGDYRFYVDERVIVPRSYFAELLREELSPWVTDAQAIESALDLCTGSGCLAILMADTFPNAAIDAVDISSDALEVARRNLTDYGLEDFVELIQSDVFDALEGRRYDLIVSNPPYVTESAMAEIPAEYRHEPALALVSGPEGLDVVQRILMGAANHLTDHGQLFVEVGHNADLVEAAWPDVPFLWVDAPSGDSKIFCLSRADLLAHFPNA
ncbi:MAG TPA: 50S ribosomal protein L3 N(5)-glutamine methyltransferase [Rhodocyclaceae bacterium]